MVNLTKVDLVKSSQQALLIKVLVQIGTNRVSLVVKIFTQVPIDFEAVLVVVTVLIIVDLDVVMDDLVLANLRKLI